MNFGMLLTGRMIQAIGAGIIIPLLMTVILYLYPSEKREVLWEQLALQ
jgi:MFS family permease